jgi:hypothetical protein
MLHIFRGLMLFVRVRGISATLFSILAPGSLATAALGLNHFPGFVQGIVGALAGDLRGEAAGAALILLWLTALYCDLVRVIDFITRAIVARDPSRAKHFNEHGELWARRIVGAGGAIVVTHIIARTFLAAK